MKRNQIRLSVAALLICFFSLPALSQQQNWKSNPRELVRKAIQNQEAEANRKEYFTYRDVKRKKNGTVETKQILETPKVVLGRLVAINGQPLSEADRKKEDGRLNRLINSPDELAKKKKEQNDDDQRVRRMVKAIPDAFNFEYESTEPTKNGDIVTLKFSPNPDWEAPNRELEVFTGMSGIIKIAVPQDRLALIQAKLFKDVNFGWGILGHLDKGGDFIIQQSQVYGDHWDVTHMKLHFTGKVLLFKSLNIQQDDQTSDYQPVPEMTVAQGLEKLKQAETEYAKNSANGGGK